VLKFGPVVEAQFLRRPNRFLVRCRLREGNAVRAFLPNPGRLWELLLPGATLYLNRRPASDGAQLHPRKTEWTVLAVEREGAPILLDTHATNTVARCLLERKQVPSLERARIVRAEVAVGRSRFDFLLEENGRPVYLEVKSCTLFGHGVAMFPDAVTERGKRHLFELAALSRPRARGVVLFIVYCPNVRWFMPDYHTDLEFSRALLAVRKQLLILPVGVTWGAGLALDDTVRPLETPWEFLEREVQDTGSYLLILRLRRGKAIRIGSLGPLVFPAGYYVYVGSAMQGLSARIAWHRKREKAPRWHVDYLRREAEEFLAIPIRSSTRQECNVVRAFAEILEPGPSGFGSSDCRCPTHLFRSARNPLHLASFHAVLQCFRMRPPIAPPDT